MAKKEKEVIDTSIGKEKALELALSQIEKLNDKGFRLEINSGIAAGQEIFRTHVHIIPYYDD